MSYDALLTFAGGKSASADAVVVTVDAFVLATARSSFCSDSSSSVVVASTAAGGGAAGGGVMVVVGGGDETAAVTGAAQKSHARHLHRSQWKRANLVWQKGKHLATAASPLNEEVHAAPSASLGVMLTLTAGGGGGGPLPSAGASAGDGLAAS